MDRNTEQIDEQIGKMLSSLDRVEAPADFAMRVKARIAAEKVRPVPGQFWRFVRISAPILAVLMIAVLIWVNDRSEPRELDIAVAEPESREFVKPVIVSPADNTDSSIQQTNTSPPVAGNKATPQIRKPQREAEQPEDGRGSRDFAVRGGTSKSPLNNGATTGFETQNQIPIRDVLSDLGIETRSEGRKLVVTLVRANTIAERSGVEPGDAIDAIDDKPVSPETVFLKSATGANLTVVRRGARVVLPLR